MQYEQVEGMSRAGSSACPVYGGPNHVFLNERTAAAVRDCGAGTHVAAPILDLDRFKPIKDAHGHHARDQILIEVGGRPCGRPQHHQGCCGPLRGFSMTSTAEGVETQAQRDLLVAEGIDELQGYVLGKPLPEHETLILLAVSGARRGTPAPRKATIAPAQAVRAKRAPAKSRPSPVLRSSAGR